MTIQTARYIRKPIYVDAVLITEENFAEIAKWCQGELRTIANDTPPKDGIHPDKQYIRIRVTNPKNIRQTKAFVGDWVLWSEIGYKIYTQRAFEMSFDKVEE